MKRSVVYILSSLFLIAGLAACDDPSDGGGQQQPPAPQSQQ